MAAQKLHSVFGDQLQVVAISTSACTDKSDRVHLSLQCGAQRLYSTYAPK